MGITYSECVFVDFGIQYAVRMRHIAICSLPLTTVLFDTISQTARFSEKKKVIEHKMYVLIFLQRLSETFLILC
jgi:hypothetical protein